MRTTTLVHDVVRLTLAGLILCVTIPGCGATTSPAVENDLRTKAALVGPLCTSQTCTCRKTDQEAGQPPPNFKRFEFRLGSSPNKLRVDLGEMVLYKDLEQSSQCFYVDLPPGEHKVRLHARNIKGIAAGLAVSEMQSEKFWWYQTFRFQCGAPGPCDTRTLNEYKHSLTRFPKNVHDPCGSAKIRNLTWRTDSNKNSNQIEHLEMQFTLDIKNFTPQHHSDHPNCAHRL